MSIDFVFLCDRSCWQDERGGKRVHGPCKGKCHAALKSVLPHFRCRLGGSTRRKSLYPSSLGTSTSHLADPVFAAQQFED
jgi:hypothetical protein